MRALPRALAGALPRGIGPPPFVLVLLVSACYWRLGYAYGTGDHEELLPQLLRVLDPTLFPRDPYLLAEAQHFSVRVGFIALLRGLCLVMPPPAAVFVLSIAAWAGVCWAAYRLSHALVPSRPAAALAVLATLVTAFWTPGGNEIAFTALAPESLAWTPCLLAVEAFARGRLLWAAAFLGMAAWMQPLMGLQVGLLLGLVALWQAADGEPARALGRAAGFGALFFVVAAPVLVPSLLTQTGAAPVPADGLSTYYVTAELRQPHHYLLFSQPVSVLVRFALVVMAGLGGLAVLRRSGAVRAQHVRFAVRMLVVVTVLVAFYVAMTEGAGSLTVAKMQFFRLTVVVKLVLLAWASGALVALLPTAWQAFAERLFDRRALGWAVALAVVGVTVAMAAGNVGRPGAKWGPGVYARSDVAAAERWVREATPRGALFLVPPSTTTFRSHALRSIVVDHKSTPFRDAAMHERLARLRAVAPAPLPARGGPDWQAALDSAYHAHTPPAWAALAARFGANYALVDESATPAPPSGSPAFRSGHWAVYRLR